MIRETSNGFLALPERSRYSKGLFALVTPETVVEEHDRPARRAADPHGSRQTLSGFARYVVQILMEVKRRPLFFVIKKFGFLVDGAEFLDVVVRG